MNAPYGTIKVQRGDEVIELPLPCHGTAWFDERGLLTISDQFGTWILAEDGAGHLAWEHCPSPWLAHIERCNELRRETLAFLDKIGDVVARDLAARIRKEHW